MATAVNAAKARLKKNQLAVGIGIYLPMSATFAVIVGAVLSHWYSGRARTMPDPARAERFGTLIASGLIVGESLWGVVNAALIVGLSNDAPIGLVPDTFAAAPWLGVIGFLAGHGFVPLDGLVLAFLFRQGGEEDRHGTDRADDIDLVAEAVHVGELLVEIVPGVPAHGLEGNRLAGADIIAALGVGAGERHAGALDEAFEEMTRPVVEVGVDDVHGVSLRAGACAVRLGKNVRRGGGGGQSRLGAQNQNWYRMDGLRHSVGAVGDHV